MKFKRKIADGWDHRYLIIGRVLMGFGTVVPGEPWVGPWIGLKIKRNYIQFGVRGFACAIGVAK